MAPPRTSAPPGVADFEFLVEGEEVGAGLSDGRPGAGQA